ncbi:MAG: 23S rRNA (adenine(2503)-C(2))-methyltransferase RlmN [Spirochaetaceae bacterium]|jgi:23S rRNA (adenine2503-C2)-methyltransferase|nr:23S rRNA (adenine(2503)-C(2))-methyltransferase RlmN [Spirochaetaceae bacterium]
MNGTRILSGIPQEEIEKLLSPLPSFRARQIFDWLRKGVFSFSEMTNLPQTLREDLSAHFLLRTTEVSTLLDDDNNAVKAQIKLQDGSLIESVLLTDGTGRKTACLSTQAGCPMGCVFCKTGSLGFFRNLNSAEIVEQFYHFARYGTISNIVFMGMGEPLLNLTELHRALSVLCSGFSKRRVTVSTCGIIPGIRQLAETCPAVRLAVSVPTADQQLRNAIMPGCAAYPLSDLKDALFEYQRATRHRITLETVVLGGVNTGRQQAAALASFARGLDVLVNLIPWNSIPGLLFQDVPLRSPHPDEVKTLRHTLEEHGIKTEIRKEKGRKISGACGQLGLLPRTTA